MASLLRGLLLVAAAALCAPPALARRWIRYSHSEESLNPATCRPGHFMTGMRCTGRYCDNLDIQCSPMSVKPLGPAFPWTSFSGRHTCAPGNLTTGIKCWGDYCHAISLQCTPVGPMADERAPDQKISEEIPDGYETPEGYFIAGVKCVDSHCDDMYFTIRKPASAQEVDLADQNKGKSGISPLDVLSNVSFVVAVSRQSGAVWLGSKEGGAPAHFRNTSWMWQVLEDAPSADYRFYTFAKVLPSNKSFQLEGARDPSVDPPMESIVALATAGPLRLTCVVINETIAAIASDSSPPREGRLFCLPYTVLEPRVMLLSDIRDKVEATALLSAVPKTRSPICNPAGPFYNDTKRHPEWLEDKDFLKEHFVQGAMEKLDKLGYPIIRTQVDLFLNAAQAMCDVNRKWAAVLPTALSWDFQGSYTVTEEDVEKAEETACTNSEFPRGDRERGTFDETVRISLELEVRNRELALMLVQAYANVLSTAARCFKVNSTKEVRQRVGRSCSLFSCDNYNIYTNEVFEEYFCDLTIPVHMGISLWELGGESANMAAYARYSDCSKYAPPSEVDCPWWMSVLSGTLGLLPAVFPGAGTVLSATAKAASAAAAFGGAMQVSCDATGGIL